MRLTNAIRKQIEENVVSKTFSERENALQDAELNLADAVYKKATGGHAVVVSGAPQGFFPTQTDLYFALEVNGCKEYERMVMREERRVPFSISGSGTRSGRMLIVDAKIAAEYVRLRDVRCGIKADRREVRSKTRAILHSATTMKKLLEVWPEAKQFLPETDKAPDNLPAVVTADLNNLLRAASKV